MAVALETMTDKQLLDHISALKRTGSKEQLLAARREGVRRGIVIKLTADLLPHERLEIEAHWRTVSETRSLVYDLEPPTRSWRHLTDIGIEVAKERLARAVEQATAAELHLCEVEKRLGLQTTIKYQFTDYRSVDVDHT